LCASVGIIKEYLDTVDARCKHEEYYKYLRSFCQEAGVITGGFDTQPLLIK
jgi:hypothetical protein